jgi:hypothetical protein
MRYFLFLIVVIIASFGGFLAYYLGAFKPVALSEQSRGPFIIIYKDHVGPYHKTVSVITEVEKWAQDKGLGCKLSFGEYPDDPETVEEARLKSRGGCLYDKAGFTLPKELPAGFHSAEIPARDYVIAIFNGSPGIGPMKVYPQVMDYMREKKLKQSGAVIEVYEIHSRTERNSMTTTYLFPI